MNDESNKPRKSTRRWLRFSLRTFLIAVTLICVWLAWFVPRVERQKNAVAWVKEKGGTVEYAYEFDSDGKLIDDAQLPGPRWLHNLFSVDYFSDVSGVYLDGDRVNDITPLSSFTNLKSLDLMLTQVTDLTPLSELRNLESLNLFGTQITDLKPLFRLSNLKSLDLMLTAVPENEIRDLQIALPYCRIHKLRGGHKKIKRGDLENKPSDDIFDNAE